MKRPCASAERGLRDVRRPVVCGWVRGCVADRTGVSTNERCARGDRVVLHLLELDRVLELGNVPNEVGPIHHEDDRADQVPPRDDGDVLWRHEKDGVEAAPRQVATQNETEDGEDDARRRAHPAHGGAIHWADKRQEDADGHEKRAPAGEAQVGNESGHGRRKRGHGRPEADDQRNHNADAHDSVDQVHVAEAAQGAVQFNDLAAACKLCRVVVRREEPEALASNRSEGRERAQHSRDDLHYRHFSGELGTEVR